MNDSVEGDESFSSDESSHGLQDPGRQDNSFEHSSGRGDVSESSPDSIRRPANHSHTDMMRREQDRTL